MPDGRPPISSARITAGDIARHTFGIGRRGYDVDEVKAYLQTLARSIEVFEAREEELRTSLAEAEERAAHPVLDEATLTAALGQHSAQILRHAHDEAAKIVLQAQEGATTFLRDAENQANELQVSSEGDSAQRVAEAELMVNNARQQARLEADRARHEAQAEADEVISRAKEEGRALLEQVQESRRRVLADLAARRRTLSVQIEQLRAARDEMAAAVQGLRSSVDGILYDLEHSDEQARAAAQAAGDEARANLAREAAEHDVTAVVPGVGSGHGPDGHEDPAKPAAAPSVDELFARIRAGTTDTPDGGGGSGSDAASPGGPTSENDVAAAESAPPKAPVAAGDATTGLAGEASASASASAGAAAAGASGEGAQSGGGGGGEDGDDADGGIGAGGEGPDHAIIVRRDELLSPITAQLSRHVKRALGDDQNRLLDVVRSKPQTSTDELLGAEDLHLSTFSAAAQGHLGEAFAAGSAFGGGPAGASGGTDVEQAAAGLSRTVVSAVRRRIAEGDGEEMAERVGTAFREWRGERIERLVGDFAVQAFSAGVAAAVTTGGKVRWVLTSATGCSDCDDNALAGPVPVEEGFPTGHAYPPAHSGCRCLVTPD
jgi:DivIVA domain-containing protein